jgi:hypothetical protein
VSWRANGPTLKDRLLQTDRLYVSAILASAGHVGTPRPHLAGSPYAITLEHAFSIRALPQLDHLTSAITPMRSRFEATTRALWIHFAALVDSGGCPGVREALVEESFQIRDYRVRAWRARDPPYQLAGAR